MAEAVLVLEIFTFLSCHFFFVEKRLEKIISNLYDFTDWKINERFSVAVFDQKLICVVVNVQYSPAIEKLSTIMSSPDMFQSIYKSHDLSFPVY